MTEGTLTWLGRAGNIICVLLSVSVMTPIEIFILFKLIIEDIGTGMVLLALDAEADEKAC